MCQTAALTFTIMVFFVCLALFLGICVFTPGCHGQLRRVTVRTPLGNVSGRVAVVLNRNVHQFFGVPYAEPPLNELRFRKPVPVQPWSNTLDATEFASSCPQPGGGRGTSEDCLYLNIYVRANDSLSSQGRGFSTYLVWVIAVPGVVVSFN